MESDSRACNKVSIVDLGELGVHHEEEPSQQEWKRVIHELEEAFTDMGCAYVTGHGIPEDLMKDILTSGITFFKTEKDKTRWQLHDNLLGYISPGTESFYNQKEVHESYLFKPGMFDSSDEAPSFMATVKQYFDPCQALSRRLMAVLSYSLNKPRDYFGDMHKDSGTMKGTSAYRINYYPPAPAGEQESVTGFGAHFDYTIMSFILGNDSEGFQVRNSGGQWIDVPYVPGAILVLCGKFIEHYSKSRFKAAYHRVVLPDNYHARSNPRCTLIYFEHGDEGVPMWPPSEDPNSEAPPSITEFLTNYILSAAKSTASEVTDMS